MLLELFMQVFFFVGTFHAGFFFVCFFVLNQFSLFCFVFFSSSCKTSQVENGSISGDGRQQPADGGRVVLGRNLQVRL